MNNPANSFSIAKVKAGKRRYEMTSSQAVIGSLDFTSRYKKEAVIEAGGKQWKIARTGWWKQYIELEALQSPYSKSKVTMNYWKGMFSVRTDDHQLFTFKKTSVWKSVWAWHNDRNEAVIELRSKAWSVPKKGTIETNLSVNETILWLSLIGWFVMMCSEDDAAAAAV